MLLSSWLFYITQVLGLTPDLLAQREVVHVDIATNECNSGLVSPDTEVWLVISDHATYMYIHVYYLMNTKCLMLFAPVRTHMHY